jgi:hypothetical protein
VIKSDERVRKPTQQVVRIEQKRTEEQRREDLGRNRRRNQKESRIVSQYHSY